MTDMTERGLLYLAVHNSKIFDGVRHKCGLLHLRRNTLAQTHSVNPAMTLQPPAARAIKMAWIMRIQ